MRTSVAVRRKSFWLVITVVLALTFILSACGSNPTTSTGSTSTSTPTATTPTASSQGNGTQHGCPSNAVFIQAPAPANVVVHLTDSRKAVAAHKGDVIEFQLPFGQQWTGPRGSLGNLQLQSPAGYAWDLSKACIWRFTAMQTGQTELDFTARAICVKAHLCPEYVLETPFTVDVK